MDLQIRNGVGQLFVLFSQALLSHYTTSTVGDGCEFKNNLKIILSSANEVSPGPTCQKVYVYLYVLCISGLFLSQIF